MKYRDYDALAHNPRVQGDAAAAVNHVAKRSLKTKNAEVVFDPAGHKEFITGFRKRKQQRRGKALKELQEKTKQDRLLMRAEKRAKLKEELGVGDDWGVDSSASEGEGDAEKPKHADGSVAAVRVYSGQGVTTTVTTLALDSGPESSGDDEEEEEAEEEQGMAQTAGGAGRGAERHFDSAHPGHFDSAHPGHGQPQHTSKRQQAIARKGLDMKRKKGDFDDKRSKAAKLLQKMSSKLQKGAKPQQRRGKKDKKDTGAKGSKGSKGGKGGKGSR